MNMCQDTLYTLSFCTGNSIWTLKINDKLPERELHIIASQSKSKPDWQYPFIYPFYSTLIAFHQSSMYNSKNPSKVEQIHDKSRIENFQQRLAKCLTDKCKASNWVFLQIYSSEPQRVPGLQLSPSLLFLPPAY